MDHLAVGTSCLLEQGVCVCCSPFQTNTKLLEDAVTGLLYSHLTMALISPGDYCCCIQQINVLTHILERRKMKFGYFPAVQQGLL